MTLTDVKSSNGIPENHIYRYYISPYFLSRKLRGKFRVVGSFRRRRFKVGCGCCAAMGECVGEQGENI